MSHGGGGGGDGALVLVPVEAAVTPTEPVLDAAPFLFFQKNKAPELLDLPLKPPIYKCDAGHLMCSPCRGEGCGRGADALAGAVWVPCDYARFGCDAGYVVYHDVPTHRRACQYAPCCCPADGCPFAGARQTLLDHVSAEHSLPIIVVRYGQPWPLTLPLSRRWYVLVGEEDKAAADRHRDVFLVFVAEGAAVSLVCVRADGRAPGAPQFSCKIAVEHPGDGTRLSLESPLMSSICVATVYPSAFSLTSSRYLHRRLLLPRRPPPSSPQQ